MYVKVEVINILQIFWPRHALLRHLDWQRARDRTPPVYWTIQRYPMPLLLLFFTVCFYRQMSLLYVIVLLSLVVVLFVSFFFILRLNFLSVAVILAYRRSVFVFFLFWYLISLYKSVSNCNFTA